MSATLHPIAIHVVETTSAVAKFRRTSWARTVAKCVARFALAREKALKIKCKQLPMSAWLEDDK